MLNFGVAWKLWQKFWKTTIEMDILFCSQSIQTGWPWKNTEVVLGVTNILDVGFGYRVMFITRYYI